MSENTYDDYRPGMMRLHIGQQIGKEFADQYSMRQLRSMAKAHSVSLAFVGSNGTKADVGFYLAQFGLRPDGGRFWPEAS